MNNYWGYRVTNKVLFDYDDYFDRFYKVEKARREIGTGLGLSIVREIVESHGGTVAVQSEEGIGSDFYFTLPIAGLI